MPKKPKLIVIQWTDNKVASRGSCSSCHKIIDASHTPEDERDAALKSAFVQHVKEKHSDEDFQRSRRADRQRSY